MTPETYPAAMAASARIRDRLVRRTLQRIVNTARSRAEAAHEAEMSYPSFLSKCSDLSVDMSPLKDQRKPVAPKNSAKPRKNEDRNARILALVEQGRKPAEIARSMGVSRGVVLGVRWRAQEAAK